MPSDNSNKMASPLGGPTGHMKDSILGRLPAELRVTIYELATEVIFEAVEGDKRLHTHSSNKPNSQRALDLQQLLAPLRVCKQMRDEILPFFFHSRAIRLRQRRSEYERHKPILVPEEAKIMAWSEAVQAIPMFLRSPTMKFEYQYIWSPWSEHSSEADQALSGVGGFKRGIQKLIHAVGPNEVVVTINVIFAKSGAASCTEYCHEPATAIDLWGTNDYVCCKDDPMRVHECEALLVKIPTKDATRAYSVVKWAFAERRRRLEVHLSHRVCFIRPGVKKALQRLEWVEKKLYELMGHLPYSSGAVPKLEGEMMMMMP